MITLPATRTANTFSIFGDSGVLGSELVTVDTMCSSASRATTSAPLCRTVRHVVSIRPEKKVVWVHARRVIAPMADETTGRDRTKMQHPRKAVRLLCPDSSAHLKDAVPELVLCASPNPTLTGLIYMTHKSVEQGNLLSRCHVPMVTQNTTNSNTSADGTSSNGDRVAEHGIAATVFVAYPR